MWPSGFDSESKTTLFLHNLGKIKIFLCNFQEKLHSHLFRKAMSFFVPTIYSLLLIQDFVGFSPVESNLGSNGNHFKLSQ